MTELGDFSASSLGTLVQMVATGVGITLLPASSLDVLLRGVREVVAVPFQKPAPSRTIGLAWRRTSPRAEEFAVLSEALR